MKDRMTYGDTPPKWFQVMTLILAIIAIGLLAWTVFSMLGCGSPVVDYAKARNPGCTVLKVTEKRCGTEVVLQCPFNRFETICLSENK